MQRPVAAASPVFVNPICPHPSQTSMTSAVRSFCARVAPLVAAVALVSTSGASAQPVRPAIRGVDIVAGRQAAAGEVLVKFRGALPAAAMTALGVESRESLAGGVHRLRSTRVAAGPLVAMLVARPDVEYAEPNYLVRVAAVPRDPYFDAEAGLLNHERPGSDIHATAAWDIATGTRASVVAVLDSGVDYRHPDLASNLWSAPAAFTVTVGGHTITCPAGTVGFNAVRLTCDPMDDHGHGTAMAGVIGAEGDNGVGVAGVNWTASLMALKFIGPDGIGSYADAINAIDFAVQINDIFASAGGARVRVLSNSWTGTGYSRALLDAIERAGTRNILMVASAGNDGADNDLSPVYPASFEASNILSVLATGSDDSREPYSNFGVASVDVGAPGLTYSTVLGGGYGSTYGTSVAAALVSGAASLVLSRCGLPPGALKEVILDTADPVEALRWSTVTGRRVNLDRALRTCAGANVAPRVSITSPVHLGTASEFAPVAIAAEADDADGSIVRVDFYAGPRWVGRDAAAPFRATMPGLPAGSYSLSAVATDEDGATAMSAPITILVRPAAGGVPSPWQLQDIGSVPVAGQAAVAAGATTVQGSGADVWGTADAFTFLSQPLTGDGEMVARVTSLDHVHAWSKAGIMIRDTASPSSAHAFLLVSASRGVAFQRRTATGSLTTHTAIGAGAAPQWLKLSRTGATVTAWLSGDGSSWTAAGSDEIAFGTSVSIGLAVTSHSADQPVTARFESVSLATSESSPSPSYTATWPDRWTSADVGATGLAGSAIGSARSITVTGAGADVWGTADAFHFAYGTMHGDGQIVARIKSVDGTAAWTKAGVMLRGSLDPGAAHAFMLVSRAKGVAFQRRLRRDALTVHTGVAGAAPLWVRLVREGRLVTGFVSSDGAAWTLVARDEIELGAAVMAGVAVSSHDATQPATATFEDVSVTPAPLPPGWTGVDVGPVGEGGSSRGLGSTFAITGAGADVWGAGDAFQFAYTTLPADGSIVARVESVEHVHAWTKAGVMVRQSLAAGSPHAFMLVSAGKGLAFQWRATGGSDTSHVSAGGGAAPFWVKLTRSGSTMTGAISPDGVNWTIAGAATMPMTGAVHAGLAVSSHDPARTATATFTTVRVESP
jgi:regulation of enolase protein 1 (concanavalin A-like superfamily)